MVDSVRHLQRVEDTMAKYHGQLDFYIYAAEIACPTTDRGSICQNKKLKCPFKSLMFANGELYVCRLRSMRVLMGEHVKQDDVVHHD
jgi:hypothetical protein